MHDRDAKVTKAFVAKLKEHVVRHNASPNASPNMNGRCEQYVGTIRWERLGKFIISGKRHLDSVCEEFTRSYNEKRSHMACGHLPPLAEVPEEVETLKPCEIRVRECVGGLVKSFERKAG